MVNEDIHKSSIFPYFFALAALLVLVALTYTNRVDDLDLWWHLKTGEQILSELSLPGHDTFAYTTDAAIPLSEQDLQGLADFAKPGDFPYWGVNLNQSWLGQVLFYLAYAADGFRGVGLLKALVFVLTFLVSFCAMRKKGAGPMAALLVISLTAVIAQDFAYSRPQIFSFLCLAILLYLFAEFKSGGRQFMALPLLFLVWSNIHGGFAVGAILLLAFWASETGKYLLHRKYAIFGRFASPAGDIRQLSLVSLLSLLAMLLNPNHYKTLLVAWAIKNSIFSTIEEYARPMLYEYHAYWFMLALAILLLILLVRYNDPTDVLFVALLAVASQMGIRAIILFALGVSPFLAASLSQLWQWTLRQEPAAKIFALSGVRRIASYRPQLIIFLALLLLFGGRQAKGDGFLKFSMNADRYPGKAVEFLQAGDFPGRLFNPYNWGGYLIWQYPQRQVFIDGRCLDEQAFFQHQLIINARGGLPAPAGQPPLWKKLLNAYGIQVVLTNAVSSEGVFVPLVDMLAFDSEWALVYQDGTALVFLRDSQENRNRFGSFYLNKKERIFDEIVSESRRGLRESPATSGYYLLLGSIYMQRRELGQAREQFERYLRINPNDVRALQSLNMIRQLNGEPPLPVPQKPISPHNW